MEAVRIGAVLGIPEFNGIEMYWWNTIYCHVSSFEMGNRDLGTTTSLVGQTEKAVVIKCDPGKKIRK